MARGLSNAEVAERLFLSPLTIKAHVSRILDKLSLREIARARHEPSVHPAAAAPRACHRAPVIEWCR